MAWLMLWPLGDDKSTISLHFSDLCIWICSRGGERRGSVWSRPSSTSHWRYANMMLYADFRLCADGLNWAPAATPFGSPMSHKEVGERPCLLWRSGCCPICRATAERTGHYYNNGVPGSTSEAISRAMRSWVNCKSVAQCNQGRRTSKKSSGD